jgi:predicted transcriptional regulator
MQFYVKDIMSTDMITVKENAQIRDLIKIFVNNKISGVPVLDMDGMLIGVVSAADILKKESSHSFYFASFVNDYDLELLEDSKFFDMPVSSIMSEDLFTVEPDDSLAQMAKIMYEKKVHRLLVIEYDKLIGIATTFDILKVLATSDESVVI